MSRPALSVVVISYKMRREVPRTILSLSPALQRGIAAEDYEIILVDNGSPDPPDDALHRSLAPNLVIHNKPRPAPHTPVPAINEGLAMARGDLIGVMIDGARMASPGLLDGARKAAALHPRPVIGALSMHLGPQRQSISVLQGYNQQVEDQMLAGVGWEANPYRLFNVSVLAGACPFAYFGPVNESTALFMPRAMWDELGGFDPAFSTPGGGLVNYDTYRRASELPGAQMIMLLGEATFHQYHGGIATSTGKTNKKLWKDEYQQIRGRPFRDLYHDMLCYGKLHPKIAQHVEIGAHMAREFQLAAAKKKA